MGTNFYARHIPSELEYARMQEALTNKQLDRLRSLLDCTQKSYHIGKRSGGWQFLWAPHIEKATGLIVSPWENFLESIKEYLSRPNVVIYNEYEEEFTFDEFWNEISYCVYNDQEKYINAEQYYKENPSEHRSIRNSEFTTAEGLRFSTTADFC